MHWRTRVLDLALVVVAVGSASSVLAGDGPHRPLVAAISFGMVAVLLARRIWPFAACLSAMVLLAVGLSISSTSTFVQFISMIVAFGVAGSAVRGWSAVVVGVAGLTDLAVVTLVLDSGAGVSDFALSSFICLGAFGLGAVTSRRGRHIHRLSAEVALSEERELLRTKAALAEERARIARELHDVVSHGLSVVVVQSQAARGEVDAESPAQRHLNAAEVAARDALAEMRRMLGLLQLDDLEQARDPDPPTPGLRDLAALVERSRDAGLRVSASLPVEPPDLGAGLELAAYRIVQESLTNVVKHAAGAQTTVAVEIRGSVLELEVVSAAGAASQPGHGGHGLIGMRERVAAYGGRLSAQARPEGGWRVHATLPLGDRAGAAETVR